jgi:hypothetical protein
LGFTARVGSTPTFGTRVNHRLPAATYTLGALALVVVIGGYVPFDRVALAFAAHEKTPSTREL